MLTERPFSDLLDDLHEKANERRRARRAFREAVASLPAGALEQAWDEDLIPLDLYEEGIRWRYRQGLEP